MFQKYINHVYVEDWIQRPMKMHAGGSVIWKAVVKSIDVIESCLAWFVGNGRKLRVGEDPWVRCTQQHHLPKLMVDVLR